MGCWSPGCWRRVRDGDGTMGKTQEWEFGEGWFRVAKGRASIFVLSTSISLKMGK